jgi:hypothetical protein
MVTTDMEENIRSVGRVAALDAKILCLGHGIPLVRDTAAKIREFAAKVGAPLDGESQSLAAR